MQFYLNNGVCVEFDVHVLPYLKIKDQEVLQIAANDPNRYLKELSPEFKDCLLDDWWIRIRRFAGRRT